MLDPETGVGAYQISGGASGGFLEALNIALKVMNYYLIFKALLKVFSGVVAFSIAPFVAMLSGITEVTLKCKSQGAAHLYSGILVAVGLIQTLLAGLYAFGPIGFAIFVISVIVIKTVLVRLMTSSPVCVGE